MFSAEFKNTRSICDPKWKLKMILRSIQVFIAVLALAVAGSATSIQTESEPTLSGTFIMYIIAWGVTVIWALVNLTRLRYRESPFHPGAVVSVDLIAWLWYGWISMGSYLRFIFLLASKNYCDNPSQYATDSRRYFYQNQDCQFPSYSNYMAALVFMAFGGTVIALIHFYLFVRGCVETHRRRNARFQTIQAVSGYNANFSYGGQKA